MSLLDNSANEELYLSNSISLISLKALIRIGLTNLFQSDFMNGFQGSHYKFMVTDKAGFIGTNKIINPHLLLGSKGPINNIIIRTWDTKKTII